MCVVLLKVRTDDITIIALFLDEVSNQLFEQSSSFYAGDRDTSRSPKPSLVLSTQQPPAPQDPASVALSSFKGPGSASLQISCRLV